ncbi:MAG: thioesterase [Bacteroidetes bacterium]|jgi:acyl-ACP thioesterase|nr:thioesterase [Bacteroidota bacterium]
MNDSVAPVHTQTFRLHSYDVDQTGKARPDILQWILDSFPVEFAEKRSLSTFEINYLSEAQLGDTIVVSSEDAGDHYYCDVKRESDNLELCRAPVNWK